uniref:MADS-box domain-containing protein n=1 Tax=Vitis vinifera TaxID=29760 RepID=A5BSC5_VITVI|nr:hypothetical protein VITISV_025650 [Vitis vinifera]
MGRRKLSIRRLQSGRERQAKYSQRKQGILRKANDLAVLCDTDVLLLMFSPTGKPCLTVGQNKNLLTVMERLASLSVDYREERRLNSDVDQKNFSLDRDWKFPSTVNDLGQIRRMENSLSELMVRVRAKKPRIDSENECCRDSEASARVKFLTCINNSHGHLMCLEERNYDMLLFNAF